MASGRQNEVLDSTVVFTSICILAAILTWKIVKYLIICYFKSNYYKGVFAAKIKRWGTYYNQNSSRTYRFRMELLSHLNAKLEELGGDVVELGPGPGRNTKLLELPQGSQLIVVDYNPEMEKHFRANLKKLNPKLPLKEFIVQSAEDINKIDDESVSVVLATQFLCSLEKDATKKVLQEIKRILKPGGYYFFLEHVVDKSGSIRKAIQWFLTSATGIWPLVGDGCCPDKESGQSILEAGFGTVSFKRAYSEIMWKWTDPLYAFITYIISPRIWGYAVKKGMVPEGK